MAIWIHILHTFNGIKTNAHVMSNLLTTSVKGQTTAHGTTHKTFKSTKPKLHKYYLQTYMQPNTTVQAIEK